MVKCKICGYEVKTLLMRHLKFTHGITSQEYLSQFPNSDITSKEFKLAQKNKDLTNAHKAVSNRRKEDWKNLEYREKMHIILSKSMKRRLGVVEK